MNNKNNNNTDKNSDNANDDQNNILSNEQKYIYLEQIRDYIYKDVVLADTKASFALTIVAFSLAAFGALFDKIAQVTAPLEIYVDTTWIIGLMFAGFSVLCAMLTILPRSYISHEIATNESHWIHMNSNWKKSISRRFFDASNVIYENIWQRQTKGTTQSLSMLINSDSNDIMVKSLHESMVRALFVQNLKFLWVGKSLLFAFLSFVLISISLFLALVFSDINKENLNNETNITTTNNKIIELNQNLTNSISQLTKEENQNNIKIKLLEKNFLEKNKNFQNMLNNIYYEHNTTTINHKIIESNKMLANIINQLTEKESIANTKIELLEKDFLEKYKVLYNMISKVSPSQKKPIPNNKLVFLQLESSTEKFTTFDVKYSYNKYNDLFKKYLIERLEFKKIKLKNNQFYVLGIVLSSSVAKKLQHELMELHNKKSLIKK